MPVIFHADAEAELEAAADYYEGQKRGLGSAFEAAVEDALGRVARMPRAFALHGAAGLRKCLVRRFPYTVYFLDRDADIWVAAVAHQSREPDYWRGRAPE